MKGFSQLAATLIDLTKKGAFEWTTTVQEAYDHLKEVMSSCLVLALQISLNPLYWSVMHQKWAWGSY